MDKADLKRIAAEAAMERVLGGTAVPLRYFKSLVDQLGGLVTEYKEAAARVARHDALFDDYLAQVERIGRIVGEKGEDGQDGYSPVKGKDYFDGKDGKDGKDGRDGKDGLDAKPVDVGFIARTVLSMIRTPKDGKDAIIDEDKLLDRLVAKVKKDKLLNKSDIDGLENEIASYRSQLAGQVYGKDTWARGGGDTVAAGTNVTLGRDSQGRVVINATGGSGSSPLTTKGDLYGFSTLDARIPVGANNTVLTADSTQPLGVKWGTVAGTGDVVGPASATDGVPVLFDGTTGKLIKNSTPTGTGNPVLATAPTLSATILTGLTSFTGSTSGTTTLRASAVAGTTALVLPAANDTLVGRTTTDIMSNKDLTSGTNTFPTFNQNTTGSAAKWTTPRTLAGNSVDGSANVAFANKFIVQGTADAGLSAAQFLGSLGTGIVKNTTTTGVLSIATGADLPAMTATVGGAVPTPPNNTTTFLRGDGTFAAPSSGFADPLTTDGDIIARISGATTRLPQGSNGSFLGVSGGTLGYYTPGGSGDMVLASVQTNTGAKTFLDGTMVLRNVANTFSGVFTNTITAARTWTLKDASGTIAFTSDITGTNSGTNTGDQTITLTGDVTGSGTGSFAATVKNALKDYAHGFTTSGTVVTGKVKGFYVHPQAATLVGWNMTVDAGTMTVKVWKIATGTAKPTIANVINTSGVAISTGTHITSTTMSDFTTTAVAAGDIFAFEITAVSGVGDASFELIFRTT